MLPLLCNKLANLNTSALKEGHCPESNFFEKEEEHKEEEEERDTETANIEGTAAASSHAGRLI